jgi:hypothetical protein
VQIWFEALQGAGDSERYWHQCRNISEQGLYVEHRLPFLPGQLLRLALDLGDDRPALEVQGRVANMHQLWGDEAAQGNGIEFVQLSGEAKERLQGALRRWQDASPS